MRAYVIKRVLLIIPTLLLTTVVIFLLTHLLPTGVVDAMLAESFDARMDRDMIEHSLGLDVPLYTQYGRWIGVLPGADGSFSGLFQGNLGLSLWTQSPVLDRILASWPVTFELALMALIIGQLIALPIGIYSAIRQDTWGDYIGRSFAIGCISIPYFWVGTMIIVFPSIWWDWSPPLMVIPFTEDPIGNLKMFIVPALVLGMVRAGGTMRMTRSMVLEVMRQDYIRTAWAKGLSERIVVIRHTLKNALIPVVTLIGLQIPFLIGGTVIVEQIFMLPGIGRLIVNVIVARDYTMVSGTLLLFSIILLIINLMVDLTYAYLDPRIRYR